MQIGEARLPVGDAGHLNLTEHRCQQTFVPALGSVSLCPLSVGNALHPRLTLRPEAQMALVHAAK